MNSITYLLMLVFFAAICIALGYEWRGRQPVGFRLPNRNRRKMEDSHYTWFLVRTASGPKWVRFTDEALARGRRDAEIDPTDQPWKV
jgi:hypothetical protein